MKLSNGKMSLSLEISEDVYWNLTSLAAQDCQHVEEWLENYLDINCAEGSTTKEHVLRSENLSVEAGHIARLVIADDGLDLVSLCNVLAKITSALDKALGVPLIKLSSQAVTEFH